MISGCYLEVVQLKPLRVFPQPAVGEGVLIGGVKNVCPDTVTRHRYRQVHVDVEPVFASPF